MAYQVTLEQLEEQPMLAMRATTTPAEIGPALQNILPKVWQYATTVGVPIISPPFSRYHHFSDDRVELEGGICVAGPVEGRGEIQYGTLPAGAAAVVVHHGPYDKLKDAYGALEKWIEAEGRKRSGPPWEVYMTDPTTEPDSSKWETRVYQPLVTVTL